MKFAAWMLLLTMMLPVYGQDSSASGDAPSQEISSASKMTKFSKASSLFSTGKYESTIEELDQLNATVSDRTQLGLIMYWKGICYNRLQNFPEAIAHFDKSLNLDYSPQDLNYEYGQALFAADKLQEARLQFRESLKRKFKRGVSLYYIAYISSELGDKKKAVTFYKAVDKLGEEGKEVQQASQVQIGDIYLEQVEKSRDAFKSVEAYVIPQYQYALALNPDSGIAGKIREKITTLQRKYDLVLFKLRNGRPVLNPPYFLRAASEVGMDTNVTFAPTETTISKSKQSSGYARADVIGRYTFYHRNYLSISPEFRYNRTYYFKRVPEIYRNDNFLIAPAIRTAFEHSWKKKPAAFLLDYDYADARRDVNARKELEFSSRTHTVMLGERFNLFEDGESIIRFRQRIFDSFQNTADSTTSSLVFEQVKGIGASTLLLYFSYDRTKVKNSLFDNNAMTLRGDFILPRFGSWFTPSAGLGLTTIDPVNNREARGRELLINPNVRLSRAIGRRWRGSLKYDYSNYQSKDKTNFAFKKSVYALELEYLF